jgi:hypothetical protein
MLEAGDTVPVRLHDADGTTATLCVVDEQTFDPSVGAYERGWWCRDSLGWWFVSQSGRVDMHHGNDEPGDCLDMGVGSVIRVNRRERGRS